MRTKSTESRSATNPMHNKDEENYTNAYHTQLSTKPAVNRKSCTWHMGNTMLCSKEQGMMAGLLSETL